MNSNDTQSENESGLSALIRIVRRRWLVVLIPVILVPCIAAAYALSRENQYSATASVLFGSTLGSDFSLSSSTDKERESATNLGLASLREVSVRTARALGNGVTAGTVSSSVVTSADGSANLLTIEATNTDRKLVAPLANEYARQFQAFRRDADRRAARQAQDRTRRRLDAVQNRVQALEGSEGGRTLTSTRQINDLRTLRAERRQLLDEAQKLGTFATLSSGSVEVAQRGEEPGGPSSSGPAPIVGLGVALGLLVGLGLALLFEVLDRRLRDPAEIEQVLGRPTLGAIPLSPALARDRRTQPNVRGKRRGLGAGEMEAFHMLRANLRYFEADRQIRSVVVTSAAPGEGKSTVAWNLAAASANAGNRVLLIEAELRKPVFVRDFKLDDTRGLVQILAENAEPDSVVRHLPGPPARNGDGNDAGMDVIAAGGVPPNPTDLLESDRMAQLIRAAEEDYDLVVIDTPPVSVVSDAIPILKIVDGVIAVTLLGSTSRDAAGHLRRQLEGLNVNFLGVVINGISSKDGYYGSAYGYEAVAAGR